MLPMWAALLGCFLLSHALPMHKKDISHRHEIDDFSLHHVYTYSRASPDRIVKHRTQAGAAAEATWKGKFMPSEDSDSQVNASAEPFHDQLSKISTFLKMNTNAYPSDRQPPEWWLKSAFEPLYTTNETHFQGRPETLQGEIGWRDHQYREFAASIGLAWPTSSLPIGGPADDEDIGLAVSVYHSRNRRATVLVFRGTFSYTNFEDIALWYGRDWIFYRWRELILHDWRDVLGMPVTEEMLLRGSGLSEWFYNGLLWHVMRHMRRRLAGRISMITDATSKEIDQQGYWPVLKKVVRDILPAGRVRRELGKVYLTGHSKGGALASQVSMWLAKEQGVRYETYALESTGYQCWIHNALEADIDLSDHHHQIVTYRDILSHYSRLDYQVGRVYTYGTDQSRAGLQWCSAIVGYPGAHLFLHPEVTLDAARCRYFHHDTHAMIYHLLRPGSPYQLSSGGVPKGHYTYEDIRGIAAGDARCPLQPYGLDFALFSWLVVFLVFPILLGVSFCAWVRKAPTRSPLGGMELDA